MARQSYHHGNLRQALVEATIGLIEEKGPLAFTLAEAARQAGVSAAAPYRHFAGRDDLLEEVARQGFVLFRDMLEGAYDQGRPTPLSAVDRLGTAYLRFAERHRGYYMAMFESGVMRDHKSPAIAAALAAHGVIVRAAEGLFAHLPARERPPALMVANHIWALAHGVVELFARQQASALSPLTPDQMLESGVLIYLRGLGVIPPI